MSASQLFDWPTARAALDAGWRIRRYGWSDRWLARWTGGLVWIIFADIVTTEPIMGDGGASIPVGTTISGVKRVVQNTDFGANEFYAQDWTNLPPECIAGGTTPGTGINGCPLPYVPPDPIPPTPNPVVPPTPDPVTPPHPPIHPDVPPIGPWGPGGGGGGGGGGGNTPHRDPQNTSWPTISVTAYDKKDDCYSRTHEDGDFVHPVFVVSVSMSSPANYSGPSFFFVTVKNGSNVVGTGTLAPGGEQSFEWTDPFPAAPGSTLTFSARAWASGAPDLQTSGQGTLRSWCDANCNPPTCCPGEDGHNCGNGCCCCPAYYAPNGPDCSCIYVG